MVVKKTRLIRGLLQNVTSQRTQYKPYGYELSFGGASSEPEILIEIEVPASCVVDERKADGDLKFDGGTIVLNLDGLKAILKVTADAIDELDVEYKKSIGAM